MNAVDRISPKFMSCAAACRGFCRLDSMLGWYIGGRMQSAAPGLRESLGVLREAVALRLAGVVDLRIEGWRVSQLRASRSQ